MTKLREWTVIAIPALFWACGSPEQSAVDQFFRAAQTNDRTTLAYMSAVGPPVDVESWKVLEVSSRSEEPFTLPELLERFAAAEKKRNESLEARTKYGKDQQEALEQIIPKLRDDPEYKFRGKLGEVQEEWSRLLDEHRDTEREYQELKQIVQRETSPATKSVMRQLNVGDLRGSIAVTEMLLNLKPRDGDELPFKVTLRKYALSEPESDRIEPARWVIVDIEGATPEARAAAAAAKPGTRPSEPVSGTEPTPVAHEVGAEETATAAPRESSYLPRELRGQARVQILTPETKIEGNEVVSKIGVRNTSRDWIAGFMVTEHWYDKQGNAVRSNSQTHRGRFMPGEVLELELRTGRNPDFFQNQFEFSHANGDVNATRVESFSKPT